MGILPRRRRQVHRHLERGRRLKHGVQGDRELGARGDGDAGDGLGDGSAVQEPTLKRVQGALAECVAVARRHESCGVRAVLDDC